MRNNLEKLCSWKKAVEKACYVSDNLLDCKYRCNGYNKNCENYSPFTKAQLREMKNNKEIN